MESVAGGKRDIAASGNSIGPRQRPKGPPVPHPRSRSWSVRLIVENAGLKADREGGNARLTALGTECRRACNGKGENGIR